MDFIVAGISSSVELVYQNEDAIVNVYPQYHQVGDFIYVNIQPNQWVLTSDGYQALLNESTSGPDSVPMIQLVYTVDVSSRAAELNIFQHFTRISTMTGKVAIFCSIQPTIQIRLRYRILNRFDLAVFCNRYFAIGMGFMVNSDHTTTAALTGYNPVRQVSSILETVVPDCSFYQSGFMHPEILCRLLKLEHGYDLTFGNSNCFKIRGYSTSSGGSEIITEYADYAAVVAIAADTWYQNCGIQSVSDDATFTTAEALFAHQQANSLDITQLYTQHVTDFNHMLADNPNLSDIIGLDCLITDSAQDISYMFENDTSLTRLDLSSLRLNQVGNIEGLFKGCSSLTEIIVTSINFSSLDYPELYTQPDIFTGVPDDCHIVTNTEEEANKISSVYPNLTNVTSAS